MATISGSKDEFKYQPLPRTQDEVHMRLIYLQPGDGSDEITCKIVHTASPRKDMESFKSSTPYEALSYTWGPPISTHSIILNGHKFPVRENLFWALWHLREKGKERVLWIDALCINQDDVRERNTQVSQMGLVYRGTAQVVVWLGRDETGLGLGEDGAEGAMGVVRGVLKPWEKPHEKEFWVGVASDFKEGKGGKEWEAIRALCSLEYWKRLWIIQEVVLGYHVRLYWGQTSLSWIEFRDILDAISKIEEDEEFGTEFRKISEEVTESMPFRLCRQKFGGGKARSYGIDSMFDLLCSYRDAMCFDIRDKVFGMHGISSSEIPVDYEKAPFEICGEVLLEKSPARHPRGLDVGKKWRGEWDLDALGVVADGEFVHKVLVGENVHPKKACEKHNRHLSERLIRATGNISGEVYFITEILEKYRQQSLDSIKQSLLETIIPSNLTPQLNKQLTYLSQLLDQHSDSLTKDLKNSSRNRCHPIPETASYGVEPPYQSPEFMKAQSDWDKEWRQKWDTKWEETKTAWIKEDEAMYFDSSAESLEETMACLISIAISNLDFHSLKEIKLFFSSSGLIGFASPNIVKGDMVCTFRESRTLVIARESAEKYQLVGISSSFSRDVEDSFGRKPARGGMMDKGQVAERMIRFHVDIGTLQLICGFDCEHSKGPPVVAERSGRRRLNPYL